MELLQINKRLLALKNELGLKKAILVRGRKEDRFEIELQDDSVINVRFNTYSLVNEQTFKDVKGSILSGE